MKAKLTLNQEQVLTMIRKAQPGLTNLKVSVQRAGYDPRDPGDRSADTFSIEAEVDVAVPILDGGK